MLTKIGAKLCGQKAIKMQFFGGFGKYCLSVNYTTTASEEKPVISSNVTQNITPTTKINAMRDKQHTTGTLTDSFGRHHTYLRISLTERCNLRCTYCMPAEGVSLQPKNNLLTTDEILHLTRLFVEQGVRKVRLTGGEPTVRADLVNIIGKMKEIPQLEQVGITTNGLVLTRLLVPLQRAGLDALNISLDTLQPKRFEMITRRKGWERVIAAIDLAIQLGYRPKVNCVLMQDFNADEICDFVEFTRERSVDVRFIEYMPFSGNKWQTDKLVSFREALETIKARFPNFTALPNGPNDTSKAYAVPEYAGQVGFITSMTEHFCGTCNRLRITADGNIKVCLFGNTEYSLRDAIRSGCSEDDLVALVAAAVKGKKKQHADGESSNDPNRRITTTCEVNDGVAQWLELVANFHLPTKSQQKKENRDHHHHYRYHRWQHKFHLYNHGYINRQTTALFGQRIRQFHCTARRASEKDDNVIQINRLTHIDDSGKASMVDVSDKASTLREATAQAVVHVGTEIAALIRANSIRKGDVLSIAQLAGISAAKQTSALIPLCHNIGLSSVRVQAELDEENQCVIITASVRSTGRTGVEMEALTAATIASLTVYDMCKAVSHDINITNIRLMFKSGGKRTFFRTIPKTAETIKK